MRSQCWVYRNLLIFIKDRWVELGKDAIKQQWLVSFWGHSCEEKWFSLLLMEMFARKQLLLNVLYVYWGIQGAENDSNTLKYNNLMPNLIQMLKPILQLNGWVSPQLDSWQFKYTKYSFKGECFISTGWSPIAQWGILMSITLYIQSISGVVAIRCKVVHQSGSYMVHPSTAVKTLTKYCSFCMFLNFAT